MQQIPLPKGGVVLVDDADFAELSCHKWHLSSQGYPVRMVRRDRRRAHFKMHHAILGKPPTGMVTDHKNMNKLDNRRENLRFVTKAINTYNRPPRSSRCVYWFKGKWNIRFTIQNKTLYFGRFEDEAEARSIAALLKGALMYHELTKGG